MREFDLRGFFDNVDLKTNKERLKECRVPEEIANNLYLINRSIVRLKSLKVSEDLMDESANRKVIFNTTGEANPNLSKYQQKVLNGGISEERTELILELKELGYATNKEIGVPQGAPTSCGLSLLNLIGLFDRLRKLVMYADDGVYFPEDTEKVTEGEVGEPEAGVYEASEKSGWIKKDGKWIRSMKFLGLEYIPAGIEGRNGVPPDEKPRIQAATRNGSELEYGLKQQLLTWLESEKEKEEIPNSDEAELSEVIEEIGHYDDEGEESMEE